jgi:hypothetical protein
MSKHTSESVCKHIVRRRERDTKGVVKTFLYSMIQPNKFEYHYVGSAPDTDEGLEELIAKRDAKLFELRGY